MPYYYDPTWVVGGSLMNIVKQILFHARFSPHKPAVAFTGGVATYAMLGSAIHSAANKLLSTNLVPGNLVGIDVRNPFHHMVLILAAERCGLTSLSIPAGMSVKFSGIKLDATVLDRYGSPNEDAKTIAVESDWFVLNSNAVSPVGPDLAGDQYWRVVLSSGTTGIPKAVGLSPAVMERRLLHGTFWGSDGGRTLTMLGFSTVAAISPIFTMICGGITCFAPNPEEVLHFIRLFGVTQLFATSGQLESLVNCQATDFEPCPSLRMITVGGSRVPDALMASTRSLLCNNVVVGYGSTETGMVSYARIAAIDRIKEAVGYLAPWAKVEAVDEDSGVLPPGQAGRLRIWTDMAAEYVAVDREARSVLDEDGWFYPGDIGWVRDDGLVGITGRSAELINRGGAIVAPHLIEEVLTQRPEVAQAGAFGVMNDSGFEEIWAAIVPKTPCNHEQILRFCHQCLGDKTPDILIEVGEIPRTHTGKIMRNRLREIALQQPATEQPAQ